MPTETETFIDSIDERQRNFVALCINVFGHGQHAYADDNSLKFFMPKYIAFCLKKASTSPKVNKQWRMIARTLYRKLV